jgi:hypothetical protein
MIATPFVPVYPVIVIAPLFVVKVNCACNVAGTATDNNIGSSQTASKRWSCLSSLFMGVHQLF